MCVAGTGLAGIRRKKKHRECCICMQQTLCVFLRFQPFLLASKMAFQFE